MALILGKKSKRSTRSNFTDLGNHESLVLKLLKTTFEGKKRLLCNLTITDDVMLLKFLRLGDPVNVFSPK